MYCSNCGSAVRDNDKFCIKCGRRVISGIAGRELQNYVEECIPSESKNKVSFKRISSEIKRSLIKYRFLIVIIVLIIVGLNYGDEVNDFYWSKKCGICRKFSLEVHYKHPILEIPMCKDCTEEYYTD